MARPSTQQRPPTKLFSRQELQRVNPIQFFKEVIAELRKAVWPSRQETIRLTYIVIIISLIVGLILSLFDLLFAQSVTRGIVQGLRFFR